MQVRVIAILHLDHAVDEHSTLAEVLDLEHGESGPHARRAAWARGRD